VLAAYNAGENAVLRFGQSIPPYRETQLYVPAVLTRYLEWREPPPPAAPARIRIQYLPGTVLDPAFAQTAGRL
jgi:lysozyme